MKIVKNWLIPLGIAFAAFFVARPVLAQTVGVPSNINVGAESVNGYTQVFYIDTSGKHYITEGNIDSRMPSTSGTFVTYVSDINGAGQIFLYDVVGGAKTQLTFLSTNLNPKVDSQGKVVWEGWVDGKWQIFLFDGKSIKQLTSGDTALNPDISGDFVSYGRRDVTGTWRAVVYSLKDDKSVDVALGENTKNPKIVDGRVILSFGTTAEEKFPLSVSDLFLLNLQPLSTASSSADPILTELTATQSGVVEIPLASQSALPIPQATSSAEPSSQPTPGM